MPVALQLGPSALERSDGDGNLLPRLLVSIESWPPTALTRVATQLDDLLAQLTHAPFLAFGALQERYLVGKLHREDGGDVRRANVFALPNPRQIFLQQVDSNRLSQPRLAKWALGMLSDPANGESSALRLSTRLAVPSVDPLDDDLPDEVHATPARAAVYLAQVGDDGFYGYRPQHFSTRSSPHPMIGSVER